MNIICCGRSGSLAGLFQPPLSFFVSELESGSVVVFESCCLDPRLNKPMVMNDDDDDEA